VHASRDSAHSAIFPKHTPGNDYSQQVGEKDETENENESDNRIDLQAVLLPFLNSFIDVNLFSRASLPLIHAKANASAPLFIIICTFRI
jgi:hypothetical protein